jgi:hypothetical protein
MTKKQIKVIQMEAIIKQVKLIERLGAHLAMIEACETIAGVMHEQNGLISLAEHSSEEGLKDWVKKCTNHQGRLYSGHFLAIRDALRLGKLSSELIEQTNGFLEDGGEEFLESLKHDNL